MSAPLWHRSCDIDIHTWNCPFCSLRSTWQSGRHRQTCHLTHLTHLIHVILISENHTEIIWNPTESLWNISCNQFILHILLSSPQGFFGLSNPQSKSVASWKNSVSKHTWGLAQLSWCQTICFKTMSRKRWFHMSDNPRESQRNTSESPLQSSPRVVRRRLGAKFADSEEHGNNYVKRIQNYIYVYIYI